VSLCQAAGEEEFPLCMFNPVTISIPSHCLLPHRNRLGEIISVACDLIPVRDPSRKDIGPRCKMPILFRGSRQHLPSQSDGLVDVNN
jgi:hypothetical protein